MSAPLPFSNFDPAKGEPRRPIELVFESGPENSSLERRLHDVATSIERHSGGTISVRPGRAATTAYRPCLTVRHGGIGNIHYSAVPDGLEAAPFRELLARLGQQQRPKGCEISPLPPGHGGAPAEIVVFVAPNCPHCPQVVRTVTQLAVAYPRFDVTIVDVQAFATFAEKLEIRSVPVVILNNEMYLDGSTTAETLFELVSNRGNDVYHRRLFQSHLHRGAFNAAAKLLRVPSVADSFVSLWHGSGMGDRLALMLTADEVLGLGSTGLDHLVVALTPDLSANDAALRGDTADLLGRIGHDSALPDLRALVNDENPDVAEIAEDAIESIEARRRDGRSG